MLDSTQDSASRARSRIIPVAHGRTDVGRQRGHNEDAFVVEPNLDLFVVCDGMGGNNAGEVASALATTSILNFFRATVNGPVPGERLKQDQHLSEGARRLVMGVRKANSDVFEISSTRLEHKGMGSTIVAMSVSRDTGAVQVAHVGDSRCYRIREGKLEQLTRDHSLIGDALAWNPNLSEEELSMLPKNIISRALGLKQMVEVDIRSEYALPGDTYLLCSDGLSGMVKDAQILELFQLSSDLPEVCENLIALANDAGGADNITAVAVRLEPGPGANTSGPEIMVSASGDDALASLEVAFDGTPGAEQLGCSVQHVRQDGDLERYFLWVLRRARRFVASLPQGRGARQRSRRDACATRARNPPLVTPAVSGTMPPVGVPPIAEFLEVVKRSLGAEDVRILDETQSPTPSEQALVCELPTGQLLAVSFAERPTNLDSARRRLEMLVRAFSSTLSGASEPPDAVPKGRALHDELAALVERAGALDAVVIDATSPAIWGGAILELPEILEEEPAREPDNVIRIDRQPGMTRRSELFDRARELGVRAFEALAIDPRAMLLVPREVCEKYCFLPLFGVGSGLLLAMAEPTDLTGIHRAVLTSGLEVEPCLANERLIRFVLAWNRGSESRTSGDVIGELDPEKKQAREELAKSVRDRWARHFAIRKAITMVRGMPELGMLHKGGHLNRSVVEPEFALIARSFAAIYVLVVVFPGPFEELRAKHAISQALPIIESLVLALPPRDPPPSISGAKAMRKPTRR